MKGVPGKLAVDEAADAPLRDGLVTDGHPAEHGDVDEVVGRLAGTGCVCQSCASF
jgi:hypothetical protein